MRLAINPSAPYLVDLTLQLAKGVEKMPEAERELHGQLFLSHQCADGGFHGRAIHSDPYYTAFALRGLVLLGKLTPGAAHRATDYLRSQMQGSSNIIDLISLVFAARLIEFSSGNLVFEDATSDWTRSLTDTLEQLRRPDGGYCKTTAGHASSTYQTFLIALTYELLELRLPEPEQAIAFVLGQQREDGGFVEIGVMRRSGTNPTAAAIGTLRVLQPLIGEETIPAEIRQAVAKFLINSTTEEGGFRANTQIPIADLLSTFTALQTLRNLDHWADVNIEAALHYVRSLQFGTGGFHAAAWDEEIDVEYSFYGVAALGLLLEGN